MATRADAVKKALGIDQETPAEAQSAELQTSEQAAEAAAAEQAKTDVAIPDSWLTNDERRSIRTMEDVKELAEKHGVAMEYADQVMGDGFAILKNGDRLIGRFMVILDWRFTKGSFGEFVTLHLVTPEQDGTVRKYIYNDGSTGICANLREYTDRTGRYSGLIVKNGFRVSRYEFEDEQGNKKNAYTYYLDLSDIA